jgi:phosphopentomutase
VPVLVLGNRVAGVTIGRRQSFSDLGATVAEWFGVRFAGAGVSFLRTFLAA